MSWIIDIKFANNKSTLTSPIRFFTEIAKNDIIEKAKKSFQNELPNSTKDNPFNKFAHTIAQDKLSFTIEYFIDNAGYVDEFGNWVTIPSNKSAFKTFTFREELKKYLFVEYLNSKHLITDKWEKKGFNKDSKKWFQSSIEQLVNCINLYQSKADTKEYLQEFIELYKEIIRFFYKDFPAIVPNPNFDENVVDILQNSADTKSIYQLSELNTNVFKKIAELSNRDNTSLFGFIGDENIVKKLLSFSAKAFDEIIEPIQFNKNIETAYYLIWRLATILSIKTKDISSNSIFSFAGNPFSSDAYYKNVSIIKKSKPTLKRRIDLIIASSLS